MLHILEPQVFTQQCKKCQTQIPFFSPHDYSFFPLNFSLLVIVLVYAVKISMLPFLMCQGHFLNYFSQWVMI